MQIIKPFIKWAGGKSQLLPQIQKHYPQTINKYCEPFIGGGAVLLDILTHYQPEQVLINDINQELINTYKQVQTNISDLIDLLDNMQNKYWNYDNDNRKIYYYQQRDMFNSSLNFQNIEQAARFIFLNKTCFNGLYRVNSKGFYNVPMGVYKKPVICDKDNLMQISHLLKNTIIQCNTYNQCLDFIDSNTFVYLDPPYRPLTQTAAFTAYDKNGFDDKEQKNLKEFVDLINQKGAKFLESNSDPTNTNNDDFFDKLYNNYSIERITATRRINSNGNKRGSIRELLIFN